MGRKTRRVYVVRIELMIAKLEIEAMILQAENPQNMPTVGLPQMLPWGHRAMVWRKALNAAIKSKAQALVQEIWCVTDEHLQHRFDVQQMRMWLHRVALWGRTLSFTFDMEMTAMVQEQERLMKIHHRKAEQVAVKPERWGDALGAKFVNETDAFVQELRHRIPMKKLGDALHCQQMITWFHTVRVWGKDFGAAILNRMLVLIKNPEVKKQRHTKMELDQMMTMLQRYRGVVKAGAG